MHVCMHEFLNVAIIRAQVVGRDWLFVVQCSVGATTAALKQADSRCVFAQELILV